MRRTPSASDSFSHSIIWLTRSCAARCQSSLAAFSFADSSRMWDASVFRYWAKTLIVPCSWLPAILLPLAGVELQLPLLLAVARHQPQFQLPHRRHLRVQV